MMLKLKLQYFGHLMQRVDSLEKTLMLGGIGGRREGDDRGWDGWMASLTRWTWVWVNSRGCWWTGRPGVLWFLGSQRVGHDWVTELNWTELNWCSCAIYLPVQFNYACVRLSGWLTCNPREKTLSTRLQCFYLWFQSCKLHSFPKLRQRILVRWLHTFVIYLNWLVKFCIPFLMSKCVSFSFF